MEVSKKGFSLSRRHALQSGVGAAAIAMMGVPLAGATTCTPTVWNLTAGQTTVVGTLTVWNDATNLYVEYKLTDANCSFGTLHLWVGTDQTTVPSTPTGIPIPGQFPYKQNTNGGTSYTFTIPLDKIPLVDIKNYCGTKLFVYAHAEVNCNGKSETAWGGDTGVNIKEPGRWYFYGVYTLCCGDPPPPPPVVSCQTAFAKGQYVFATDPRANPEGLKSLGLSRNRWGWAINLGAPGITNYLIYAGAGLNDITKGNQVGVLAVDWNGSTATITYRLFSGCTLAEVHVYADDAVPTTIAPGRYGTLASFDPRQSSYRVTVPLVNTDGKDGVWLIAHAVVCCECCK